MQTINLAVARENISGLLAMELRNRIVDGRLPAGERINEVHLALELGVSRTPLREALARLANEGALRSVPRIGYYVEPLTLEEFEQVYSIRPLLDPEALRLAGLPSSDRMARLRELNDQMERARATDTIIGLDDDWHLELIAACPNKVLVDLIRQFMRRTRRYEIALLRERKNAALAGASHSSIMSALRRRDLAGACSALRTNLEWGYQPIASWLKARESRKRA
jgi:DNA-binding GntR family transcriptional regulator